MSTAVPLKFHIARGIMAILALLCLGAIGFGIHEYSETKDSLNFCKSKLNEERRGGKITSGFDSPSVRVRRLEERMEKIPESLLAPVICLFLFGGLFYLSSAKVRKSFMTVPNQDFETKDPEQA